MALAEGMALAQHLFGEQSQPMDYVFIPTTVFASPNIAMVGYTESKAKETFESIAVYQTVFKHMKHTLSGIDERTS